MVRINGKGQDEDGFRSEDEAGSGEGDVEKGLTSASDDTFDISAFPVPPVNGVSYDEYLASEGRAEDPDAEDDLTDGAGEDGVEAVEIVEPGWDVVFLPGENPRIVVRAALVTGDPALIDEGALVEASAALGEDDVKRLLDFALKVERFHSAKYKFWRRLRDWAWRRKFFSGATIVVLLVLGISSVINALR